MQIRYELSKIENDFLNDSCEKIIKLNPQTDEEIIKTCNPLILDSSTQWDKLAYNIRNTMKKEKKGILILENLPKVALPPALTAILGFLLGKVIKEYKGGVWFKEIKADNKLMNIIDAPSSKDTKEFALHTDLSYIDKPPNFFLFHCLINSPNIGGASTICNLNKILEKISKKSFLELHKNQFHFVAPSYYLKSGYVTYPILTTIAKNTTIRFRKDGIRSETIAGMHAINELNDLFTEALEKIFFSENSAMYIDNHRCLHGRFSYHHLPNTIRYFNQVYII